MSDNAQKKHVMRFRVAAALLLLGFGGVAARATYLHVFDREFLQRQGDARALRTEPVVAHRGMIRDRNGLPLAVSTPVVSIWANPQQLLAAESVDYRALAQALEVDVGWLRRRLQANGKREFLYLKRHLSPSVADQVLKHDWPGIYGLTEYRRFYPESEVTAHIIGFTDLDDVGKEGLELAYDQWLQGEPGAKRVVKDLKGRQVKDVALIKPARPGKELTLSIDARAQYMAYRELAMAVEREGATAGIAVALDVETGEVLAMVNQPAYNPNNRKKLSTDALRNRAATDMFEPGSTMKPFTVVAGLESGKYNTHSLFDTNPGTYRVYNKLIRDHENYGVIDIGTILTKSSNVGAAQIALSLPPATLPDTYGRFGFGHTSGSGFPGESGGLLPPPARWRPVEIATMSYGYGMTTTALQLAHAYATLASGGIERPVSFVKVNGVVPGKRVLEEKIARAIIPMMESVITQEGTALKAAVPGYRIAGKTGTAHKAKGGGYANDEYMSLFVGMAPASRPRIVLAVVVDNPSNGRYYGGLVAAPVFSKVMAELLRLMNIEPDRSAEHLAEQGRVPSGPGART